MTKWLASVQSLAEAQMLLPVLPDILDMKNPAEGALGAMAVAEVEQVVTLVDKRCITSATIGDMPMQADLIADRILAVVNTGVDYVKIGIFPDQQLESCIDKLALTIKENALSVIAVMFADNMPKQEVIGRLHKAGVKGVMIDTAFKNGKTLLDHWSEQQIETFVNQVQQLNLICGLAGSLRIDDVTELKKMGANYLGFRSALCENAQRKNTLSSNLGRKLKELFP